MKAYKQNRTHQLNANQVYNERCKAGQQMFFQMHRCVESIDRFQEDEVSDKLVLMLKQYLFNDVNDNIGINLRMQVGVSPSQFPE